ncbi:hypothetical protein CEXT_131051 [Caerostris extrusa]|uniref:Uncharacterized protein n=1 Tax=Caerostris extrusa TaxID=172846 RepID=A0AAV4SDK4_CAEEX|nr:hypothetical protein CEXT_131051 [Caerostris extrusa]
MDGIAYKASTEEKTERNGHCNVRLFVQSIRTEGGNEIRKNKPKHDKMSVFLFSFEPPSSPPPIPSGGYLNEFDPFVSRLTTLTINLFPEHHPKIQQQDAHSEFRPTLCRPLSEINGRYLCDPLSPGDPAE